MAAMRRRVNILIHLILLAVVFSIWFYLADAQLFLWADMIIIIGGSLVMIPSVWLGRILLDRNPTPDRTIRITTIMHYIIGGLIGITIIRAVVSHDKWIGWRIPIPEVIGLALFILSCIGFVLTVGNLALKGLGAPFAVAFSKKVATGWMYARTRNPMVLALYACLFSLGLWFQSLFFVLWAIFIFAPSYLSFIKLFEERELELRFGASYLEYKSRTPRLWPGRKTKRQKTRDLETKRLRDKILRFL